MTTTAEVRIRQRSSTVSGLAFILLALVTLALFLIPAWIIQPFKYQSPKALSLALTVRSFAPWATLLTGIAAFLVALRLWPNVSRWKRVGLVLGLCCVAGATVMSRVDYFEWMFHPVPTPGFQSVADTKLDSGEMVLSVRFGNDARAYPIRAMAYHHVVNDVVSGIPIAVTY